MYKDTKYTSTQNNIATTFDLYERALFSTSVTEARWDENSKRWIIKTDRGDELKAQFLTMEQAPSQNQNFPASLA